MGAKEEHLEMEADALEALGALADFARCILDLVHWCCLQLLSVSPSASDPPPCESSDCWPAASLFRQTCSDEKLDLDEQGDFGAADGSYGGHLLQRAAARASGLKPEKEAPQKWVQCAKCELWRRVRCDSLYPPCCGCCQQVCRGIFCSSAVVTGHRRVEFVKPQSLTGRSMCRCPTRCQMRRSRTTGSA